MQGPDEPPKGDAVIEDLETVPSFSRRGNINHGEKNSSDNLKKEDS
jgi:hypothetical protein